MREWAGVNPANGEALWYMYYVDENNNGVFDNGELSSFNGGSFEVDVNNCPACHTLVLYPMSSKETNAVLPLGSAILPNSAVTKANLII